MTAMHYRVYVLNLVKSNLAELRKAVQIYLDKPGYRTIGLFLILTLVLLPYGAQAHPITGQAIGFKTGFLHPLTGIDHVLAMLAVGMWGAELGGTALWALPVAFPLVMSLGGVAGILGLPMLPVEPGIAFSVIILGFVIATNFRPKLGVAVAIVSIFAIFHGYAHGVELPEQAAALPFCIGFVIATGLLHLIGIGIGELTKMSRGMFVLRTGGAGITCAGFALALHIISA